MQWKRFRYRLEWLGVRALIALIPLLSRRACARLAEFVGRVAFAVDGKGRRVALANIEAAFGDRYSEAERRRIGRQSYQYFARTMLDLFWAPRLAKPGWEKYVELAGREHLDAMRQKPSVGIATHCSGFEWFALASALHGYRGYSLMQSMKNPLLTSLFIGLRSATGQEIITQEISLLRMLRQVLKGNSVGLLIDLNLPPSQSATVIETFGMKMCVTHLHAILAQRAGARLLPVTTDPRPDGTCRVEAHAPLEIPPGASTREIAQMAWDFFEKVIREKPERWMWVYKHWRFRPKGATRPYPFYANESGKFEKLLRAVSEEAGTGGVSV
jgi:KDO2-lipid IV(A) lauroyltransferase